MKNTLILSFLICMTPGCASIPYVEPNAETPQAKISFESEYDFNGWVYVFSLLEKEGCEIYSEWVQPRLPIIADLPQKGFTKIPAGADFRVMVTAYNGGAFVSYSCNTLFQFKPKLGAEYHLVSTLRISPDQCGIRVFEKKDGEKSLVQPDIYQVCD